MGNAKVISRDDVKDLEHLLDSYLLNTIIDLQVKKYVFHSISLDPVNGTPQQKIDFINTRAKLDALKELKETMDIIYENLIKSNEGEEDGRDEFNP